MGLFWIARRGPFRRFNPEALGRPRRCSWWAGVTVGPGRERVVRRRSLRADDDEIVVGPEVQHPGPVLPARGRRRAGRARGAGVSRRPPRHRARALAWRAGAGLIGIGAVVLGRFAGRGGVPW